MPPRLVIVPAHLRKRRLEKVLSRQQLADLSGVSTRRIEQLEAGASTTVKPETVRKLAGALDCPVGDLIEVVDDDD